jgi:hypothetical protein
VLKKKIWANFFTKKIVKKLLKIWSWDPGSGKNLFRIPDPGVKKHPIPDPGSGSATLVVGHFLPPGSVCQIRIRIHWPYLIPIQYGSGSETLILTTWFSYPIDECKI